MVVFFSGNNTTIAYQQTPIDTRMCYCFIIATEEDHRSVVKMFGEKKQNKFLGNF